MLASIRQMTCSRTTSDGRNSDLNNIYGQSIGVCYGKDGNNLPPEQDVINLYNSKGIGKMRIYSPDPKTLQALRGTNIELILGVPDDDCLQLLASDPAAAAAWV
ncbi:hypothetical protein LguiA_007095 [Lonicera macranthoides]